MSKIKSTAPFEYLVLDVKVCGIDARTGKTAASYIADFNCVATCGGHRNYFRILSAMLLRGRKTLIFKGY